MAIEKLKSVNILVVGDVMLDRYFWGTSNRISQEAPVPIVSAGHTSTSLGGAGNVAANLAGLGCQVELCAICGNDAEAEELNGMINDSDIKSFVLGSYGRVTTVKTRIMANKQQVVRFDIEYRNGIQDGFKRQFLEHIESRIGNFQAVILSDYAKGMLADKAFVQGIIKCAKSHGVPVLVDPKGKDWSAYAGAMVLTPNSAELEACANFHQISEFLLITRGSAGMRLIGPDGTIDIASRALDVADVSGAGDTVIATMAAGIAAGLGAEQAARIANTAAGIVVGKVGTQPILYDELCSALENDCDSFPYAPYKIMVNGSALAAVIRWRSHGDKIVFTNGCFDLLHPGHVGMLYKAKSFGDRLVVGLNSDASVRRLKGDGRPVLCERDRCVMLGALSCVDAVVVFDDDTPLSLVTALRPDVIVKGSDYRGQYIAGAEFVDGIGGRVEYVDLLEGHSTTGLINGIVERPHT